MREDPKWNIGRPCVQDHEHVVIKYYYTTTVLNVTPFNVPKIGEEIEIVLDKVISVLVGAVLWNPTIGSLLIKSFNRDSSSVVITSDNLLVDYGKSVLANTEFLIGIPDYNLPTEDDYLNAPYLAADFISPGEGSCQNASVTTAAGIDIGNKVSISGYVYRVGAVIDKSTLQLCNDGEGAPEGTVLAWDTRDCGKPSVPVVVYSSSPCEATPVQTGSLVVCKDKALTTLSGEADGQMIRWNNNHKRWELVNAYIDENCTYLTTCLTIDIIADEEYTYLANVKNTSLFSVDNKIIIDDSSFIITEIVSSTQMRIKPEVLFTTITTYPVGTSVCLESCCAWVPAKLAATIDDDCWRPNSLTHYILNWESTILEGHSGLSKLSPGQSHTTAAKSIIVENDNTCYQLCLNVRVYAYANGQMEQKGSDTELRIQYDNTITEVGTILNSSNNEETYTNTYTQTTFDTSSVPSGSSDLPTGYFLVQERLIVVPAHDENHPNLSQVTITANSTLNNLSHSTTNYTIGNTDKRGSYELRMYVTGNYNNVKQE